MGLFFEYTIILIACGLVGLISAAIFAIRQGRLLNFKSLVLVNYSAVLPASGIAHMLGGRYADTGHYDIRTYPEAMGAAVLGTVVGMAFLLVGLSLNKKGSKIQSKNRFTLFAESTFERKIFLLAALLLIPVGIFATVQMQGYVQEISQSRVIEVSGRYVVLTFLSHWLVWGISISALVLVGGRRGQNRLLISLTLVAAVIGISFTLAWSGGRSIVPLMALPIIMLLFSFLRGERWALAVLGFVAGAAYVGSQTVRRLGASAGVDLVAWLDWQWGRFSMIGWANEEVRQNGFRLGETFAASSTNLLSGILGPIGFSVEFPQWQSVLELAGKSILRDEGALYIVPGLHAELMLNFGHVGIAGGMFFIGLVTSWVDSKYETTTDTAAKLLLAYVGSLLVFRTVSADSAALISYVLYSGTPLIVLWLSVRLSKTFRASGSRRQYKGERKAIIAPYGSRS